MIIVKFIIKIALLPILMLAVLGQWIGLFLNGISSVIFGILSTLIWSLALISFMFGQSTGAETIRMLVVGFVLFVLPYIGDWIIERIVGLRIVLGNFMRS